MKPQDSARDPNPTRRLSRVARGVELVWLAALLSGLSPAAAAADSRLVDAVKQGDMPAIRALLRQKVDVNAARADGQTALHIAAFRDDQEVVDLLLRSGANPNAANVLGATPLWAAATNSSTAIVEALLRAGANPNVNANSGETPLIAAARVGSIPIVKALVKAGADPTAREGFRDQAALMFAISAHHPDVVRLLIEVGADIHTRSKTWHEHGLACCQDYNKDSGRPMAVVQGGFTPLLYAVQSGDLKSAKLLLAAGANVNDRAANGVSAIAMAAIMGRRDLLRLLVEQGANLDAADGGYTALLASVLRQDYEAAKVLLMHGANPNAILTKRSPTRASGFAEYSFHYRWLGATPFYIAAMFYDVDMMRLLTEYGADPSVGKQDGSTPLMAAAGTPKPVDWQRDSRTPIDQDGVVAVAPPDPKEEEWRLEAVKFVVGLGVDVNAINHAGETALHRASAKRYLTIVRFLVDNHANVNAKTKDGLTPLSIAMTERPLPVGGGDVRYWRRARERVDAPREKLTELLRQLGARE